VVGVAQLVTMALNLVALVVIARTVGETWFGVLQWGVAFSAYAMVIAEWGLPVLGVREVARLAPDAIGRYAAIHLGLLLTLASAVLGLGAVVLPQLAIARADPFIALAYLAGVIPTALALDWVGIGRERLGTVSAVKTLRSLLYALAVLALLPVVASGPDARQAAARCVPVLFGSSFLLAAAVMAWRLRAWLGRWVWPRPGPLAEWRRRLRLALPLGAAALVQRVLLTADVILLGVLATPATVGNYAAAAKVVVVVTVAVEVVWKALLPRLARTWRDDPARCRRRFGLALALAWLALAPVAAGGAVLGDGLMGLLYGDRFPTAGPVCRILSVAHVALALGLFLGQGLVATDRQDRLLAPLVAGAAVAVIAVLVLAPVGGAIAAATGMFAGHVTLLGLSAWAARDLLAPRLGRPFLLALAGALVMVAVLAAGPEWPVVWRVVLGVVVYASVTGPAAGRWVRGELSAAVRPEPGSR
jgi:O-antigen/teichoic acid export membrane protein